MNCLTSKALIASMMAFGAFTLSHLAGEEPPTTRRTWVSPNKGYVITYLTAADATRFDDEAQPQAACYVLQAIPQPEVLWVGVSYTDSSAHSSEVLWSPDSMHALILDRPQRGEVYLTMVTPSAKPVVKSIDLRRFVGLLETSSGETDVRVLTKIWFGDDWVWRNNHKIIGTLSIARSNQHEIKLRLDLLENGSVNVVQLDSH